jgi:release factor glutamine methyltransferase
MIQMIKKFLNPILQKLFFWYLRKPRNFTFHSIRIIVNPGVFYPGIIKSTGIFLNFLDKIDLSTSKVLELGAGSGIISLLAARKGANVTASDINPSAIENINQNASRNHLKIITISSDLFENISSQEFDYILINPPYYPLDPANFTEMAWYCGAGFEYYKKLYFQLRNRWHEREIIYMILSEDCNIKRIMDIAGEHNFQMSEELKKKRMGEWFFIYRMHRKESQVDE